jgi:hypothetical protein
LEIAPGQNNKPISIIYDEHAEELLFLSIYLGKAKNFKTNLKVTSFMMATREIHRKDRRGVTPQHILYMAMKMHSCIEKNMSFCKSIPNWVQYWQQRKQYVIAMIRQLSKPTIFLTSRASEVRWSHLLQILCKLQAKTGVTGP